MCLLLRWLGTEGGHVHVVAVVWQGPYWLVHWLVRGASARNDPACQATQMEVVRSRWNVLWRTSQLLKYLFQCGARLSGACFLVIACGASRVGTR